ncbi:cytochrome c oxidase subunit II [Hyphomicrobium sulfonivorans]|nr:cytochrome c oxidase subunit II [Hyphomicrobium sulfonivorans]
MFAAAGFSGCSGELSTLSPAGPVAGSIATLWWVMAAGAALIFLIVMGLFLLVWLRPNFGRSFSQRAWILGGGLAFPIPLLVPLLVYSFQQGEILLHIGGPTETPVRIEARARMWQWEFIYLDEDTAPSTVGVLHIPAGAVVEVTATSEDVIHSFWVPRLSGKVDAIPGHRARVRFLANTPNTYRGACAEFCGSGHAGMLFSVQVHKPEDYARLIKAARDTSLRASLAQVHP